MKSGLATSSRENLKRRRILRRLKRGGRIHSSSISEAALWIDRPLWYDEESVWWGGRRIQRTVCCHPGRDIDRIRAGYRETRRGNPTSYHTSPERGAKPGSPA